MPIIEMTKQRGAFAAIGIGKSRVAKKVTRRKKIKLISFDIPKMGKSAHWISIIPDDKIGGTI